jgi:hypothetical protein
MVEVPAQLGQALDQEGRADLVSHGESRNGRTRAVRWQEAEQVLRYIEQYGDLEAFRQAARIRPWLAPHSSATSIKGAFPQDRALSRMAH